MLKLNPWIRTLGVALILCSLSCASGDTYEPPEIAELKWPRQFEKDGDRVVVYDPQVDSWKDHETLSARSAVSVQSRWAKEATYGVIEYVVDTEVDPEARQVLLKNRKFKDIRFQGDGVQAAAAVELVQRVLGTLEPFVISLDFVLAYLGDQASKVPSVAVNLQPPPIHVSPGPAILVIFMGEPQFKAVEGTSLQFATNTNWDLLHHPASSRYYLLNGDAWISAPDLKKGPWETASTLPADFWKLPKDENWAEVHKNLPGRKAAVPRVVVVENPAELIVLEGPAIYAPIPGTALSYITNTQSSLFFHGGEKNYYFLTAGRWFRARSLEGPWSAATTDLPPDFAKIPVDSPKADVRPSVPGTPEAADAVLLAAIPRTATVTRKDLSVTVTYDGAADFVLVDGTKTVYYAINSPYSVFRVGGRYYCCHNAVWFEAASPAGPWVVSSVVPVDLYGIPPTHPKYTVTYVRVYSSTPDVVVVGYTSGYYGCYVSYGVVVYGCGYPVVYHPHWHYHCYPHYYAYGGAAYYNPHGGVYVRGGAVYGPYGGAGYAAAYNPHTGTYSRSAYAYGPHGSRYAQTAYNPYTGNYAARRGGSTPYSSWGQGVAGNGSSWVKGGYYSDARGTVGRAETSGGGRVVAGEGSGGQSGFVGQSGSGNVYAGKNGEVYKKTDDGWSQVNKPAPRAAPATADQAPSRDTLQGLQRDSSARERGTRNAQQFNSSRGGGRGR